MVTLAYSCDIRTAPDGRLLVADFDCEVAVSVHGSWMSEPEVRVVAVYVEDNTGRVDLLTHDDLLSVGIGRRVKAAAEADEWLWERAVREEGFEYRGLGGNDPDGRWVRRRQKEEA